MAIEETQLQYEDLDEYEQEMHQRFHTGQLKREMIDANKEYGHGLGAPKSPSIEQMAHISVEFQQI